MSSKHVVAQELSDHSAALVGLSHSIHDSPELAFEERNASSICVDLLRDLGFAITQPFAELDTAFRATVGSGSLHIAFCAEYDALPDLGHACGHNLIAASSVGAGVALQAVADELDLTVSVIGTPAEEAGGGKILMLDRGGFDDVHAAMSVHPSSINRSLCYPLAISNLIIEFRGLESHASAQPHRGVNALDAMTISQVAIGLLRQQLPPLSQVQGVPTFAGGAPNVIPPLSRAEYFVRARTIDELHEVEARVRRCFEAGAVATGCELSIEQTEPPYSDFVNDADLIDIYRSNAKTLEMSFDEPDPARPSASTDFANVSHVIPAIHPSISINSDGIGPHTRGFVAASRSARSDAAMIEAAKLLAWTAIDAASNDNVKQRLIRRELRPF